MRIIHRARGLAARLHRSPKGGARWAVSLALGLTAATCAWGNDNNWPRFRGPGGQGDAGSANLPLTWGESQNIVWKTPIHGKAWSSPVIWGNQIWLTTATEDGRHLGVVCVDRDSGKIVRDEELFEVDNPQYAHPFNSYGSPTPVAEEGRLYVTFGSPGTAAIDTQTGKTLWERRDFVCNHYRGAGSSPLLYNSLLIMNFDGSDFQFVVALDKNTGKTVWRTNRSLDYQDIEPDGKPQANGDWRKAYSTPIIADFRGKPIVVSLGSKAVYGYDPQTGGEIWRFENRASHSAGATPVVGDGLIFVESGFGQGSLLAIKPGGAGVIGESQLAWRATKRIPSKPSPVLLDHRLYCITDSGIASCFQDSDGKELFHGRIDGAFSASPVAAGGHVYVFDETGKTTVIDAGPELKILAENQLADGIMATPAVSGNALFIRTRKNLYRIESGSATTPPAAPTRSAEVQPGDKVAADRTQK